LGVVGYLIIALLKFAAKSVDERILKIGQHVTWMQGKNIVSPFFQTRCRCQLNLPGTHVYSAIRQKPSSSRKAIIQSLECFFGYANLAQLQNPYFRAGYLYAYLL